MPLNLRQKLFYTLYFKRKEINIYDYLLLKGRKIKRIRNWRLQRLIIIEQDILTIYFPPKRHFL